MRSSQGLRQNTELSPVRLLANTNQSGTYFNGILNNGIGATFTYAVGATTIDSVAIALQDYIAFTAQTSGEQNGIYQVTQVGSASAPTILKRRIDFQSIEQIQGGSFFLVSAGTTYAGANATVVEPYPQKVGQASTTGLNNINFIINATGGGTVTPSPLTTGSDTNIVLTANPGAATALLNPASITASWNGTLSLARGGTNAALTAANGAIPYSTATSIALLAPAGSAGVAFLSGGAGTPAWSISPPITRLNVFSLSSSGNYTRSTGCVYAIVEIVGAGGGGGGVTTTASANAGAAGGGGGNYIKSLLTAAQLGATVAVTIGAAGSAGSTAGAVGGTGGNTTFAATAGTLSATGGGGGGGQNLTTGGTAQAAFAGPGGAAGTSFGINICNVPGNAGFIGLNTGVSVITASGRGGDSPFGSGGISQVTAGTAGNAGTGFGSGGSGGLLSGTGSFTGGAGTTGYFVITEFLSI